MFNQVEKAQKKAANLQVKVSKQKINTTEMTTNIKMISKAHEVELKRKDRAIARVTEKLKTSKEELNLKQEF